jgi:curved DNA-binding protein
MDYAHVTDTLQAYWPGGQEQPECVIEVSLHEAYHGVERTIDVNGATLPVVIPAGVHSGAKVFPHGLNLEGPHGYQFCTVEVRDEPPFKRYGNDLHLDDKIDAFVAILGGEVTVPTLLGETQLTIPPGTAPGTTLRVPGQGMPINGHPEAHGDLLVHLEVQMPAHMTELERKLIADNAWLRGWRLGR